MMAGMAFPFPWQDRKGAFSWLKAVVLLICVLPGLGLAYALATGQMGPKPIEAALHDTGTEALRLLIATLLITPLRLVTGWNRLILVRRMLGVAALAYALIHLTLYVVQQKYDLFVVVKEIVLRFYLTIGFLSLLAMLALGVTSTDGMIKRLGAPRWNKLHALIYPLTALGLMHAVLQSKIDISDAITLAGLFIALMLVRLARKRVAITPLTLLGIAVLAGLVTMVLEAAWYGLATGVSASRIFLANFDADMLPRPSLVVFGLSLILPLSALYNRFSSRRKTRYDAAQIAQS